MSEKSCISLAGRHGPLGTSNAQRRHNTRIVPFTRKRDHHVNSNEEGVFKINYPNVSSLALPLLAVAFVSQPAAALASDLTLDSRVALKRDVVEDMLIQRFTNRIRGVSDEELAQITERLLAEQSTFPADLLLISPGQQQQSQQASAAPHARKDTIEAPKLSELNDLEEEDDDTAELFATLGDVAAEGITGAEASTSTGAITTDWASQIPRIAKAVCIGAGLAATVPAASALQHWYNKIRIGDGGETMSPPTSTNEEDEEGSRTTGIGGFLNWVFGDNSPEKQPEESSKPASINASSNSGAVNTAAVDDVDVASMQREEIDAPSSSSSFDGDQVLWRRKDDTRFQQPPVLNGTSSGTSNGEGRAVLWRRSEKFEEEKTNSNSNGNQLNSGLDQQQQDLWRVPLESLMSSGNKEEAVDRGSTAISPKPKSVAASPRPVPVVKQNKVVNGFSAGVGPPKLSDSALDNAEPPDFVANGVHKL
ncbi:hypothetical protein Ndes2526B_g03530 [Nannochloris sp. 'desiccata']